MGGQETPSARRGGPVGVSDRLGGRYYRYVSGVVCRACGEACGRVWGRYWNVGRDCVYVCDVPADAVVGVEGCGEVMV